MTHSSHRCSSVWDSDHVKSIVVLQITTDGAKEFIVVNSLIYPSMILS